jgi:hypothetical protein
MDGWMCGRIYGSVNEWRAGWTAGWLGGWLRD